MPDQSDFTPSYMCSSPARLFSAQHKTQNTILTHEAVLHKPTKYLSIQTDIQYSVRWRVIRAEWCIILTLAGSLTVDAENIIQSIICGRLLPSNTGNCGNSSSCVRVPIRICAKMRIAVLQRMQCRSCRPHGAQVVIQSVGNECSTVGDMTDTGLALAAKRIVLGK